MGWRPSLPDFRAKKYRVPRKLGPLPEAIDLRKDLGGFANFPVWDQGQLGSCTAQGVGACLVYNQLQQGQTSWTPSRLFMYYESRKLEGTVDSDSGAMITDVVQVVADVGSCHETLWTYEDSSQKYRQKPPQVCYNEAQKF